MHFAPMVPATCKPRERIGFGLNKLLHILTASSPNPSFTRISRPRKSHTSKLRKKLWISSLILRLRKGTLLPSDKTAGISGAESARTLTSSRKTPLPWCKRWLSLGALRAKRNIANSRWTPFNGFWGKTI